MNGSLWTLPHEATCYLLLLLIGWCGALNWRGLAVLLVISLSIHLNLLIPQHQYWLDLELYHLNRFFTLFLSGAMLACLDLSFQLPWRFITVAASLTIAGALHYGTRDWHYFVGVYLPVWPAFVVGLAALLRGAAGVNRYDFSYGFYLYSFVVQQLVVHYLGAHISVFTLMLLSVPTTLILAAASWFLVEKPMLALKSRNWFNDWQWGRLRRAKLRLTAAAPSNS